MNDPSRPDTIRIERVINAPRQAVFDAWLSADVLRRWWPAGADWETPVAEVEPRVGGRLRLVMRSPDGEEFGGSGEYVAIEPPERVVITWRWDGHAAHEGRQLVEVELGDRGDGTTGLILTNTGLPNDEAKRSHREGWQTSFDNLERVLADPSEGDDDNRGGAMSIEFPGESPEYRTARNALLEREIELRRVMEAVAVARRELPAGGVVPEDYVFEGAGTDGAATDVRLSELFAPGRDSLVIYNFMFPRGYRGERPGPASGETAKLPLEEGPCPSCVALLDQLDAAVLHAGHWINFAVVAKTSLPRLLTWRAERGWQQLRLLSSAANTYNRDYFGEAEDGSQIPMLNVFHRDGDTIRHFWGAELTYGPMDPGQDHRSVGTLEPLWNLFDLTPQGRPDWDEKLEYD